MFCKQPKPRRVNEVRQGSARMRHCLDGLVLIKGTHKQIQFRIEFNFKWLIISILILITYISESLEFQVAKEPN